MPKPAVAAPRPAELIGRDRDGIARLLGEPTFVRRDPPAEYWRYRNDDCVLDLIFYNKDGAQRLDYIGTRNAVGDDASARCIEALVASRGKG